MTCLSSFGILERSPGGHPPFGTWESGSWGHWVPYVYAEELPVPAGGGGSASPECGNQ